MVAIGGELGILRFRPRHVDGEGTINGWLYTFLNEFDVSKAVVSDCTVRDVTSILSEVR